MFLQKNYMLGFFEGWRLTESRITNSAIQSRLLYSISGDSARHILSYIFSDAYSELYRSFKNLYNDTKQQQSSSFLIYRDRGVTTACVLN